MLAALKEEPELAVDAVGHLVGNLATHFASTRFLENCTKEQEARLALLFGHYQGPPPKDSDLGEQLNRIRFNVVDRTNHLFNYSITQSTALLEGREIPTPNHPAYEDFRNQ